MRAGTRLRYLSGGGKIYIYHQVVGRYISTIRWWEDIYLLSGGGTKSSNIGGGGGEDFPEGGKAAGPVQIYQLNTMSFDHDLPNVVQHKISS